MCPLNSHNNSTIPILQIKLKLREFQKLVHWQNLIRTQKNMYNQGVPISRIKIFIVF